MNNKNHSQKKQVIFHIGINFFYISFLGTVNIMNSPVCLYVQRSMQVYLTHFASKKEAGITTRQKRVHGYYVCLKSTFSQVLMTASRRYHVLCRRFCV